MFFYSSGLTQAMHSVWPLSLRVLDLSSNVGIVGPLPPAGAGYANFATIDLSNTSVSGPIPPSWSVFPSLQRIVVTDTRLTCTLTVNVTDGAVSEHALAWKLHTAPSPAARLAPL
jgi:hypothetical protein